MTKQSKILRGVADINAFLDGDEGRARVSAVMVPESIDVRSIRKKLGLTQSEFASRYGFNVAALRNWEQHRRQPERMALILLTLIDRIPDKVEEALVNGPLEVRAL